MCFAVTLARRLRGSAPILRAAAAAAILLACLPARAGDSSISFGFTGPEIFPIDNGISQLHAADLNGDGLVDLIVVNNARSKINLLYNQTGKTNAPVSPDFYSTDINRLPPDARFRIDSIASEKRISSLVVADLNGDGRPDLAYYGEPKELVVLYNQGANGWSAPKRWPIDDGLLNPNALATGDLNGDGRADLLLLAEGYVYYLAQNKDHTLAEPQKIPYSGVVLAVQALDVDGDGRDDLLLVNWDSPDPFRIRFQDKGGQLGPEVHFSMPPIRSYWADDLDGDHKTEVITIAQNSGRAEISDFIQTPAEPLSGRWRQGQFQILPLKQTTKAKRGEVWADLNGDGRPDLVVAEADSGQVTLYLQNADGTLAASKQFATLTGVSEMAVADWQGNGHPQLFLLSTDERQIGVTRLDKKGGMAFPDIVPIDGRPLVMTAGKILPGRPPVLAAIVDLDGKRELQLWGPNGLIRRQKLSDSFKSNPSSIAIQDADQDGLPDLVVLIPYEKIKVLRQTGEKFDEIDVAPPGGIADQPWMAAADVDGDGKSELLLGQRNFVRAVVLKKAEGESKGQFNWEFQVKEQINGASSNSRIVAAAGMKNDGRKLASLFLLDAERKALTLSERDPSGAWQIVRNIALPVTAFDRAEPMAIGGTNLNAIALFGANTVGWMALGGKVWQLQPLDGYETPIPDGYLTDVVTGDLNQDGRKDLVFLETAKSYLDIVTYQPPHRLVPAIRWRVFEERTFRNRLGSQPEPREAVIADLTGDGKKDLAVLVHDRILVYPQE